jgi:dihydropteroate synthase
MLIERGLNADSIIVDPGIGFGKTLQHNLSLLNSIQQLRDRTACEVMIGVSRKSMIDKILRRPVEQRLAGSIGLAVQAVLNGAKIVRVHDVAATYDAIRCAEAVLDTR